MLQLSQDALVLAQLRHQAILLVLHLDLPVAHLLALHIGVLLRLLPRALQFLLFVLNLLVQRSHTRLVRGVDLLLAPPLRLAPVRIPLADLADLVRLLLACALVLENLAPTSLALTLVRLGS